MDKKPVAASNETPAFVTSEKDVVRERLARLTAELDLYSYLSGCCGRGVEGW